MKPCYRNFESCSKIFWRKRKLGKNFTFRNVRSRCHLDHVNHALIQRKKGKIRVKGEKPLLNESRSTKKKKKTKHESANRKEAAF